MEAFIPRKMGCLLDCLDWVLIEAHALMLACLVMRHVAFGFTI